MFSKCNFFSSGGFTVCQEGSASVKTTSMLPMSYRHVWTSSWHPLRPLVRFFYRLFHQFDISVLYILLFFVQLYYSNIFSLILTVHFFRNLYTWYLHKHKCNMSDNMSVYYYFHHLVYFSKFLCHDEYYKRFFWSDSPICASTPLNISSGISTAMLFGFGLWVWIEAEKNTSPLNIYSVVVFFAG